MFSLGTAFSTSLRRGDLWPSAFRLWKHLRHDEGIVPYPLRDAPSFRVGSDSQIAPPVRVAASATE